MLLFERTLYVTRCVAFALATRNTQAAQISAKTTDLVNSYNFFVSRSRKKFR